MAGSPSNTVEDENYADILKRVEAILSQHKLPLTTERDAASPVAQRMEHLTQGDQLEMDLPKQRSERFPYGAVIGGVTGSLAGAPTGLPGAMALGALGSGGGEAVQQLVEHLTGSPEAPTSMGQAGKQIGKEMAFGTLGEGTGRLLQKTLGTIVKRTATAEAGEVQRLVENGLPFQGKPMLPEGTPFNSLFLTPAEQTGGGGYLQTLQNVAEGSFGGKSMIEEFKSNREQFLADGMQSFIKGIGKELKPGELGELIGSEISGNFQAAKAPARAVYNFLTTQTMPKMKPVYSYQPSGVLTKNGAPHMVKVQTGETMDQTTGAWADIRGLKKSLKDDKIVAETLRGLGAKEGGDDIVTTALSYPDKVPYFVAQKLRSRLASMADVFSIENKRAPALGLIKNVTNQVDQSMESGLRAFSPDAADLWRYANETYKGANKDFNNTFLRSVIRNTDRKDIPEVVLETILQPRKYSDMTKLKVAVGDETWGAVQRSALERVVAKSTKDGVIQPHQLEQSLYGVTGLGKEKMGVLFDREQRQWIDEFIKVAHSTMTKGDVTGKMAIQLAQPGQLIAAGTAIGGLMINAPVSVPTAAAAILLGPPVIARIMTDKHLAPLLVRAMKTPAKAPSSGAVVGRLLSALAPREREHTQTSRGTERMLPSTQPDQFGGLNLP